MAVADVHPTPEALTAFSLGTLGGEAQAYVEGHLAACSACQVRAAAVPDDALVGLLRRVHARAGSGAAALPTPVPLSTLAGVATPLPAVAPSAVTRPVPEEVPDDVPPELARHERYRVVRLLGVGGMGAVYEAEHRVMRQRRALKVIKRAYTTRADALERFRQEVRNAARLSHPNIVTTHDAEDAGETHFLVMEYVEGTDLARLVQERGRLPVDRACDYVRQAAVGLQYAFEQGMVHRDLKPHNLMLTPDDRVKILDFGLARFASEAASAAAPTGTGVVLGTVDYIAPEQADHARQADIRSDIYSLGCTLYHLLAGRPPFPEGTPVQKVMAHAQKKPQPLTELRPDLPEGIMPVLERMLAKNPNHRYQTPAEVAYALKPFTRWRVDPPSPPDRERKWLRFRIATAALTLLVAGLLGLGGVYHIATDRGELVIETDNDDVEVVVSKAGRVVKVVDTKSGRHVTLNSGDYELALKEGREGLKLSPDRMTLKRGEKVLATITAVAPKISASKYVTLPIDSVASAASTKSLFSGGDHERLIFPTWGKQEVLGVPFNVIDPKGDSVRNAIVLYCPLSPIAREWPQAVRLKCGSTAKTIHLLSGVSGWGWGCDSAPNRKTISVIVRLRYQDGQEENHELINGVHFCDFNGSVKADVPGSRLALRVQRGDDVSNQIRYLAVQPKHPTKVIEEIEFIKGMKGDVTAPVIMAVTVEKPSPSAETSEKVGEVRRFEGHAKGAWGVAFSPDGRHALSGGRDGACLLWEVATGREVRRFSGHDKPVDSVAFSPMAGGLSPPVLTTGPSGYGT